MLSSTSLRNMIPPPEGWPSARKQCRSAATISKQHAIAYTGNIGRHWFTLQAGSFRQPCTAGGAYCRWVATHALESAFAAPDKASKRLYLAQAKKWRLDAKFIGWRLP